MLFHFKDDLNRAGFLTVQWVRELPITLLVLFIATFSTNQYFEWLARELMNTEQGPWPAQICEFLFSLIEGVSLLLVGGYFLINLQRKMTWGEFFKKYTAPLTAESLRALTQILLWSLAVLIPGVIVYCRLTFVPFIVFLDPSYEAKPDAVGRSYELTRPCWGRITFAIFLLGALEGMFELTPNLLKVDNLVMRACIDLCGFLFSLFSFVVVYIIFENLLKEQNKGK